MKLVADLEKIGSNLTNLDTEIDTYNSSLSTYKSATIDCTVEEVKGDIESLHSSVGEDLDKLANSSKEFSELVSECQSEYQSNESNTQTIDISSIDNIISNNPDITSKYEGSAKDKLTSIEIPKYSKTVDTGNPEKDNVYNMLAEKGFNEAAICGIMANIEHESGFDLNALGDSGTSYGLCQWHYGRWDNLNSFCSENGYDPSSLEGQIEFLCHELETDYSGVYETLKNVPNTSEGAYEAAYEWTVHFEMPDNMESRGNDRGNTASSSYWDTYGAK